MSSAADVVHRLTRWVDDFPESGITFADLTPVFADAEGFRAVIGALAAIEPEAELIAGIDARGFLLGAGVAAHLNRGVLAIRKKGKLPPPVHSREYELEYGTACLEIPAENLDLRGRRVLLVDDVLATGGTLLAAADLLAEAGADVTAIAVVLELEALSGRERVAGYSLSSLVTT